MTRWHRRAALASSLLLGTLAGVDAAAAQEHDHAPAEAEPAPGAADDWRRHHDPEALRAAVLETVRSFQAALAAGDSAAVLSHLHPEARIYEGGHAETVEEYRSGHLAADMEFRAGVTRETMEERVVPRPHMALYEATTRAEGTFRDREVSSRGTETLVLISTEDGWRIRHIHWSSGG